MAVIERVTDMWGGAVVRDGSPASTLVEGAVVHPQVGRCWGVLDSRGEPVEEATDRALPSGDLVHELPAAGDAPAATLADPGATYVYGGRFNPHFGHFITETLARCWAWRALPANSRVVMVGDGQVRDWLAHPFCRVVFRALEFDPALIVHVERPTRVNALVAPEPAFRTQAYAWPIFRERCLKIGERLLEGMGRDPGPPIYLSKSRLASGVRRLRDEHMIDSVCRARGVEVIYPERLSLGQLIRLFRDREAACGTVSSAHHAALFLESAASFDLVTPVGINSNFVLIDRLCDLNACYWRVPGTERTFEGPGGFAMEYVVPDPSAVGEALCDRATDRSRVRASRRPSWTAVTPPSRRPLRPGA